MSRKYFMINRTRSVPSKVKGKVWETEHYTDGPVHIMTEKDGYAMVRRKGCMPFVIQSKDIIREPVQ